MTRSVVTTARNFENVAHHEDWLLQCAEPMPTKKIAEELGNSRDVATYFFVKAHPIVMNESDLDDWFQEATEARDADRASVVIEILSRYVARRPDDATAYLFLGEALTRVGDDKAQDVLLAGTTVAPMDRTWRFQASLGELASLRGERNVAEDWYRKGSESAKGAKTQWLWIERGCNLARTGRLLEAERCYRRATAIPAIADDRGSEAWLKLGSVLQAQRRYGEATQVLNEALAMSPNSADVQAAIMKQSGIDEVLHRLHRSTFTEQEMSTLRDEVTSAFSEARYAIAAEILARMVEYDPTHAFSAYYFGFALRCAGRLLEARDQLERAVSIATSNADKRLWKYRLLVGNVEEDLGAHARAEGYYRQAAEDAEGSTHGSLWIHRGVNLSRLGRPAEAECCYRRATTLSAEHCDCDEAWLNVGACLLKERRYDEACAAFREAVAIDPDCPANQEALGSLAGIDDVLDRLRAFDDCDPPSGTRSLARIP